MIQSAILTRALVQEAFDAIRPEIEAFIKTQPGRTVLAFQVLDPCVTIARAGIPSVVWHGAAGEQDQSAWKSDYAANAGKKVRIVWRTGISTKLMAEEYPHFFEEGDFKYPGGVEYKGIIVGASGLTGEQDHEFAMKFAEKIYELVLLEAKVELAKKSHHIGQ